MLYTSKSSQGFLIGPVWKKPIYCFCLPHFGQVDVKLMSFRIVIIHAVAVSPQVDIVVFYPSCLPQA